MRRTMVVLTFLSVASGPALAQEPPRYREPSSGIRAVLDAEPTPAVSVGPGRERLLLLERPGQPSIAELARPERRLAGLRIDPATNGRSRSGHFVGIRVQALAGGDPVPVAGLPSDPRLRSVDWSPDGTAVAFTHTSEDAIELWVAELEAGGAAAHRLSNLDLNGVSGSPCRWLPDSSGLLCLAIDDEARRRPAVPEVVSGPVIQESTGRRAAARTYQDLLENAHDGALFESFLTSVPTLVLRDGSASALASPGLYLDADPSPDGRFVLTQELRRPFSYLVPYHRFPRRVEVRGRDGALVRRLVDLPLAEEVPIGRGAVPTGPRSHAWRADADATLVWVEARDGGDPRADADVRDEVLLLPAPFDAAPTSLARLGHRYAGVMWGDETRAIIRESWWKTRRTRSWLVEPDGSAAPRLLFDRSTEDRYGDPGRPVLESNDAGRSVLSFSDDGSSIFLTGAGASSEGDRPFVDRFRLSSGESERLWRSQAPHYELFVAFTDESDGRAITRRESPSEVPNYFHGPLGGERRPLTAFRHPYPQLRDVHKEVVRYERDDGTELQATLYLPPGASPDDGPFPMLMWAYPREFKDAGAAGQMRGSPYSWKSISLRGPLPLLTANFAVFDGPTMPIVGEGEEEPNDRYVEQLAASARAAIDYVVDRGLAERDRIAIGGHSYGAFMTGNLLAHSDLFATGIARSGAYNRTLTPFGFQAEERTFWEAPEVYFAMSPFMHADAVDEPILMIHGEADNNSGTFPLQSERFYNALKGHGAKARFVMLPHESHGYVARESLGHMLWEMETWLGRWLVEESSAEASSGP